MINLILSYSINYYEISGACEIDLIIFLIRANILIFRFQTCILIFFRFIISLTPHSCGVTVSSISPVLSKSASKLRACQTSNTPGPLCRCLPFATGRSAYLHGANDLCPCLLRGHVFERLRGGQAAR